MSRSDLPLGLCSDAEKFLSEYEIPVEFCECCKQSLPQKREKIGEYSGYDEYSLYRYQLKDGRYADEYLQRTEFNSGPVLFLGLSISDGTKIEWDDWEIEGYV